MSRFFYLFLIIGIFGLAVYFANPKTPFNSIQNISDKLDSVSEPKNEPFEVFTTGLDVPWSIAFLPSGDLLVTERKGTLRLVSKDGVLQNKPVAVISDVKQIGEGGLHGITLHPDFSSNNFVYVYFTYDGSGGNTRNRVVRFTFKNNGFVDEKIIVDDIPGASNHDGGRIKFGPNKFLYITTGDAQEPSLSQNKNSLAGKILRVTDEGKPASGNPFGNRTYSYGHRNPQGITWDDKGNIWETEHGPSGIWPNCCQDELNKIEMGKNYGWPDFVGDEKNQGVISPVIHSGKDIWAPGDVEFLDGSLYFTGLRGEALYKYNIQNKKLETFFKGEFGRLRDVVLGPDGLLYVTTSNRDGRGAPKEGDDKILKINPKDL